MITTETKNNVIIVRIKDVDRIYILNAEDIKEEIKQLFNTPQTKLILDLDGIKFIDSVGFSLFLSMLKVASANKGVFKVCNLSDSVKELFKLLHLQNIFELHHNLDECLKTI